MAGFSACPGFYVLTQIKLAELTKELLKNSNLVVYVAGTDGTVHCITCSCKMYNSI